MRKLYLGPGGSGKTTKLRKDYNQLAAKYQTKEILVLLKNGPTVSNWRSELELDTMDSLEIFTYFGFVNREVKNYWNLIEAELELEKRVIQPTIMTVEPAQYIMSQLVEAAREEGFFAEVNATAEQIAIQLLDNLNQAALNGIEIEQITEKLQPQAIGDEIKVSAYQKGVELIESFRKYCLKSCCLDYSLVVDLYNKYLLNNQEYKKRLFTRYNALIGDDLERMTPVGQDLILSLLEAEKEAYLSFNPDAKFSGFFGAAPDLARENIFPHCEIEKLTKSYTSNERAQQLAEDISQKIVSDQPLVHNQFIQDDIIQEDFRGKMIEEVANKVEQLIAEGTDPGEIAIISPQVDNVLKFILTKYCEDKDYAPVDLTKNKRLIDNPFAQALIVLSILVAPQLKFDLKFSTLLQTLDLILDFDPVRSSYLAEEILAGDKITLPDLDDAKLRVKLGFSNSDSYDLFKDWVETQKEEVKKGGVGLDYLFQKAFGDLLAPLSLSNEDIFSCRQMIESIVKFKQVITEFEALGEKNPEQHFINMVNKGTLAAEVLFDPKELSQHFVVATPYTFLSTPEIKEVKYLFLIDISSDLWLQSGSKELSNPYLLAREAKQQSWDDSQEQNLQKEQLINYLKSLLSKSTQGLFIADSYLSTRGWEQDGRLADWLREDYTEVISND